jgi:hypothetical protein
MTKVFLLVVLSFQIFSFGQEPQTNTQEELNPALIQERIAKTSPEGLEMIKRAKIMNPEIQKHRSAKTLGEAIEDCISGQGQLVIRPVGWEATRSDGPRWRISFYFQDEERRYLKATWEYNEEVHALIPAEFVNATKFWVKQTRNFRP